MEQLVLACLKVRGSGGILHRKIFDSQTSGEAIYCIMKVKRKLQ